MTNAGMKALVFEPFAGGHCTAYVATILPALIELRDAGKLDEVVFTTTATHHESLEFRDAIAPLGASVRFDVIPTRKTLDGGDVAAMLCDAVARNRPQFLISTYADRGAFPLAVRNVSGRAFGTREMHAIGIMHHGISDDRSGVRARVRAEVHRFARRHSPWSEIHVVDPLLYDLVRNEGPAVASRVRLLPHPVALRAPVDQAAARARLGLPRDGRFLGQIGATDGRKAIPELLAAFRAAKLPPDRRVVMAGRLFPAHRDLIASHYDDLVRDGRLIVIDRYLETEEFHLALSAVDVVNCAYYTEGLASNLLAALAAGRPVIAARGGYAGMMIDRFGAGYATDLFDPPAFAATVARALSGDTAFELHGHAARLIRFHDPANFTGTLLAPLYARVGVASRPTHSWEQALRG